MIRKVFESSSNAQDRYKYVVDEIFGAFANDDPQRDMLDTAFDVLCKYITDKDCAYIEDNFLSKESFAKVIFTQPLSTLDKIEDDLSKVRYADYIKYADIDNYLECEKEMLDYYGHMLADYLEVDYDDVYKVNENYYETEFIMPKGSGYYVGTKEELYKVAIDEVRYAFSVYTDDYIKDTSYRNALRKAWDNSNGDIEDYSVGDIAYMIDEYKFAKNIIDEYGAESYLSPYDIEIILGGYNGKTVYAYLA